MARRDAEGEPLPGSWRLGNILAAVVLGAVAAGFCGALGWWQWERAQSQGQVIDPGPPVPIADVTRPGEATTGIGRIVTAEGSWADAPSAYVVGREVDGEDAVLLVLPLRVDADQTGIGEPATLAVLAGWLPLSEAPAAVIVGGQASATGVLRSSEAVGSVDSTALREPQSEAGEPMQMGSVSTAALAQMWPSPVYTPVLAADSPVPGWNALPPPPAERRLDLRSLTYAGEWWLFGAFAVFLAARWIRDNGRVPARAGDQDRVDSGEQR